MQIDVSTSLKGIPAGAIDIAVAVMARGYLLELIQQTPASGKLKEELNGCAERISGFIAENTPK